MVNEKALLIAGRIVRVARLQAEGYEFVDDPPRVLENVRAHRPRIGLFTFTQRLSEPKPKFAYVREREPLSILPIGTYEQWWKSQINDKTRNVIRKATKKGVEVRLTPFDDRLVAGIKSIHDEHPLRQGRPFKHYGKSFEHVKQAHATFLERSEFIGAYVGEELIGFIKLVHQGEWSSMMQIISKISHRDKSPTNALIAKAVERCAEKGVTQLQYGIWSRKSLGDFKIHHGFKSVDTVRYYVPITLAGRLLLQSRLHHDPARLLPERVLNFAIDMRTRWYQHRFRNFPAKGAVAQSEERHAKA